jgi:hypothetical protein
VKKKAPEWELLIYLFASLMYCSMAPVMEGALGIGA